MAMTARRIEEDVAGSAEEKHNDVDEGCVKVERKKKQKNKTQEAKNPSQETNERRQSCGDGQKVRSF